jgi:hypothetical protein
MPHRDETLRPAAGSQIGGSYEIMDAFFYVVWCSITNPDRAHTRLGQTHSQILIQGVSRAEHATHSAPASQNHILGFTRAMPKQTQKPIHRVHLNVTQIVGQHGFHGCHRP